MTERPWVAPGSDPGDERPGTPPGGPPPGATPPGPPPGGPSWGPPPGPPPAAPSWGPPPTQLPPGHPPGYPPPPGYGAGLPPPGYRRVEFRPGVIPLRPLQLGDIYGAVLKTIRGNPAATIGLATLTTLAFVLPTTALGTWLAGVASSPLVPGASSSASDALPDGFGLGMLGLYLPAIGQLLSGILLAGFLAQVAGQAVLGRTVGLAETWNATRGRLLPMVGAVLLTVLATLLVGLVVVGGPIGVVVASGTSNAGIAAGVVLVILGVIVFVLASLFLSTKWAFATPAIVLERVGVIGGLRRSWELTDSPLRGPFWRILGLRLLTAIIVGIASSVVSLPISFIVGIIVAAGLGDASSTGDLFVAQTVASGISGLVTGALTTPFSAGVDAFLYVDARIRREGLDVRLVQTAQGAAPPPWPLSSP